MATAYDSDDCTITNASMTDTEAAVVLKNELKNNDTITNTRRRRNSCNTTEQETNACQPITCSFYSKRLCCSSPIQDELDVIQASLTADSCPGIQGNHNDEQSSNELEEMNNNIVTILSEYYSFVEQVKQDIKELDKPVEQVRLSLQYLPCLKDKPCGKQLVFHQSSAIGQSANVDELVDNLSSISSWYNHGLLHHLSVSVLGTQMEDSLSDHHFFKTLRLLNNSRLCTLPTVSTGPQLHEGFEEIKVTVLVNSESLTLKEVAKMHKELVNILGLRTFIVLFQGISETKPNALVLVFWIPKLVASSAMTCAYQNEYRLKDTGIVQIQARYETISAPTNFPQVRESGYETNVTQSMTTDDENGFSNGGSDKTNEGEDEVFITQVSPDTTSSGYSRTMSQNHSNTTTSVESSNASSGIVMATKPAEDRSNPTVVDCEQSVKSNIHLDLEILQEIDRLATTSPGPTTTVGGDSAVPSNEPYISMNPAVTPIRNSCIHASHTSIPQGHSPVSSQVSTPRRSVSLKLPNDHSPGQLPAATVARTSSYHHYSNIPTSFVRVSNTRNIPNQSINYRVVPGRSIGFIKRVLSRSTENSPANLQMVAITNQEADNETGKVMVQLGEKLRGLYLKDNDVIVETIRGVKGRLPYSFCRISKSYYGSNSKVIKYSSLNMYCNSTSCIELCGHSPSTGIPITMVAVKQYDAVQKDEVSVKVGEQVVVLYSDNQWVFARRFHGNSGFIPRECCRLTRRSTQLLTYTKWLIPSLMFQSDFVFSLQEAPPKYLIMHPLFPGKGAGTIVMLTRNYTPPGTQVVIRKGVCVKVIYTEDYFVYVATITGSSFWVPLPLIGPAPKSPQLPMMLPSVVLRSQTLSPKRSGVPEYASIKFRNSTEDSEKSTPSKKKVSFAVKNRMMYRNSMGSNPELSLCGDSNNTAVTQGTNGYAVIPPKQTSGSHENIPVYLLFDNCNSPIASSTFCGCFKF